MSKVTRIERVAAGMVLVDSTNFGDRYVGQLWADGKARKHSTCILTDRAIHPGDRIYRPTGNDANRSVRMLAAAVDRASPVVSKPPETPEPSREESPHASP